MPENPSEKQLEGLETLMRTHDNYTFFILYDFTLENNYPNSQNIFQTENEKPIDLLNRYLEKMAINKKK